MNYQKTKRLALLIFCIWAVIFSPQVLMAQVNIVPDRENATYEVGEPMFFNVTSNSSGPATYSIQYDRRSPILATGTVDIQAGKVTQIPFESTEPSFVLCDINQSGNGATAAAAFSPYDIAPYEDEPSDFDIFWDNKKNELANIPINPNVSLLSSTNLSTTYRVNLSSIEGRRVYGYLSVPNVQGIYPAVLLMPSYGSGPNHVTPKNYITEQAGVITFYISIHNAEPDQGDPNAYNPNDISSRDGNYYRFALLGAVRAIDYLFTRDDFDKQNLGVMGVSQGGGLSLIVAGLDDRVKLLINGIPALCQHSGLRYGKTAGHPYFIFKSRTEDGSAWHENATVEATKYYDAMNFAKRFNGPSLSYMSYEDITCPPGTMFAANNQLLGSKVIVHRREEGHDTPDYWLGRFDFIRKHFSTTGLAPDVPSTTGYYANIGSDMTTAVNTAINLSATVEVNGNTTTSLPGRWEKVSGPGVVSFSNPSSYSTSATFGQSGTYVLKFSAVDDDFPANEAKWITVADYIKVDVN